MSSPSTETPSRFIYRLNRDGTWDSICKLCFRTVGTQREKNELWRDEARHNCRDSADMTRASTIGKKH